MLVAQYGSSMVGAFGRFASVVYAFGSGAASRIRSGAR